MKPSIHSLLLSALLLLAAGCGPKPAQPEGAAPPDDAAGAPAEPGAAEPGDEAYPGAQPADGRSPTAAYPAPGEGEGEDEAGSESGSGADDDASGESGDEAADDDSSAAPYPHADAAPLALDASFASDEHAYAFDYPADWYLDDSGPVVILRSEDDGDAPGSDGVPADVTKIDIVTLSGFPLDLEGRVAQIRAELEEVVEEERFTLIGGEAATWLRGSGLMTEDTGIVVTIVGGELYQLQAYGDPRPLPAIAYTFRERE